MVLIAEVDRLTQFENDPEYIEHLKKEIGRFMAEAIRRQGFISFSKRDQAGGKSLYKGKITLFTEPDRLQALSTLNRILIGTTLDPQTKEELKEIINNLKE